MHHCIVLQLPFFIKYESKTDAFDIYLGLFHMYFPLLYKASRSIALYKTLPDGYRKISLDNVYITVFFLHLSVLKTSHK